MTRPSAKTIESQNECLLRVWRQKEEQKISSRELLHKTDPFVKNEDELMTSRKKLLDVADFIIPGHGKMFRVPGKGEAQ